MGRYVDLNETVTATYYDEQHEEWDHHIVTIEDVLSEVCDDYTILPHAQPEIIRCKDCKYFAGEGMYCACNIVVQFDHFYCYYAERKED